MTLPTTYSWYPIGERLLVPYQAPEGRRVNAIGAYFTHGPNTGRFDYQTWASVPKSRAKKQRKTAQEIAAAHGLTADEVGPIDAQRVLAFIWQIAGCPSEVPSEWTRERPLMSSWTIIRCIRAKWSPTPAPTWKLQTSTWSTSQRTARNSRALNRFGTISSSTSFEPVAIRGCGISNRRLKQRLHGRQTNCSTLRLKVRTYNG